MDAAGYVFSANAEEMPDKGSILFTFDGNGRTPEVLEAYVLVLSDAGETEEVHVVLEVNG